MTTKTRKLTRAAFQQWLRDMPSKATPCADLTHGFRCPIEMFAGWPFACGLKYAHVGNGPEFEMPRWAQRFVFSIDIHLPTKHHRDFTAKQLLAILKEC